MMVHSPLQPPMAVLLLALCNGPSSPLIPRLPKLLPCTSSILVASALQGGESLQNILQRHKEVFTEELGTLQGYKAHIHVDPAVKPKFCRARTVPYARRDQVEKELERLVEVDVLEPVRFAEWAAPIVPVLKTDKKSIRICGDFKATVNQAAKLEHYPISKVEDLFAKLAGGKRFSKLDLSQAYQQILLDEDSRQYVTINTHKGLFQYKRLPFGASSAPGIFQRTMESLVQGNFWCGCLH